MQHLRNYFTEDFRPLQLTKHVFLTKMVEDEDVGFELTLGKHIAYVWIPAGKALSMSVVEVLILCQDRADELETKLLLKPEMMEMTERVEVKTKSGGMYLSPLRPMSVFHSIRRAVPLTLHPRVKLADVYRTADENVCFNLVALSSADRSVVALTSTEFDDLSKAEVLSYLDQCAESFIARIDETTPAWVSAGANPVVDATPSEMQAKLLNDIEDQLAYEDAAKVHEAMQAEMDGRISADKAVPILGIPKGSAVVFKDEGFIKTAKPAQLGPYVITPQEEIDAGIERQHAQEIANHVDAKIADELDDLTSSIAEDYQKVVYARTAVAVEPMPKPKLSTLFTPYEKMFNVFEELTKEALQAGCPIFEGDDLCARAASPIAQTRRNEIIREGLAATEVRPCFPWDPYDEDEEW